MIVDVYGPNLPDQSQGVFHVHRHGCRDGLKLVPFADEPMTIEVESRQDVCNFIYEDMYAEGSMEPGQGMQDFHFVGCCSQLP